MHTTRTRARVIICRWNRVDVALVVLSLASLAMERATGVTAVRVVRVFQVRLGVVAVGRACADHSLVLKFLPTGNETVVCLPARLARGP